MNRRSIFGWLLAALPGAAKVPEAQPAGELILDCSFHADLQYRGYCRAFVDGVEIPNVYYINFTRGFVRQHASLSDVVRTWFDIDAESCMGKRYARPGHCFVCRFKEDWPSIWWEEVPIPDGCEVVPFGDQMCLFSRTIYGKIETRPI